MRHAEHRIAYDHQTFSLQRRGGISRYFCEIADRINDIDGFSAVVFSPIHINHHLQSARVPRRGLFIDLQATNSLRLMRGVNQILAAPLAIWDRPTLLHRTFYKPLPAFNKAPTVLTVFDMIYEIFPERFPDAARLCEEKREVIERAEHVICISHNTARDLKNILGVPDSKITVTHLGYSEVFNEPPSSVETSPHLRPFILYVGHRAGYKNFDALLLAYSASPSLRDHVDIIALGGPPFDASELDRFVQLGLKPSQVQQIDGDDNVLARHYRWAEVLVYPSLYEGFGIPPLEAMACGCPVICANTSSLPEVVGSAAILFDPTDPEKIRYSLEEVLFNRPLQSQLREAGRLRARRFSWDYCAIQTAEAYQRIDHA